MHIETVDHKITHARKQPLERKKRKDATGNTRTTIRRSKPFIAWDGEGYSTEDGRHHYALFGSSTGLRVSGLSMDWRECLRILFQAPRDGIHVIYAGTYDIIMMFGKTSVIKPMLKGLPVYVEQYRIHWLRGKFIRITDRETKETRTLYDVFTFFGTSFVNACKEYLGSSETLDRIAEMKLQRNTFTKDDTMSETGSVETYMSQELQLLAELCETLRKRMAEVNIHPTGWHGPGAVASSILRREGITSHKGSYSTEFRRCAESAYYGGRFEQFQRGTYEGTVYQYDIRSAYPAAMAQLPSLATASWELRDGSDYIVPGIFDLVYVRYDMNDGIDQIGYAPYRNHAGSIYYPSFVNGWYWGCELPDFLLRHVVEVYQYYNEEDYQPFAFVPEMYRQRAEMKAKGEPAQLALKLGLNSLYGKLAQSKGAKFDNGEWIRPTFHEIVWAGLITAMTRRKISDALHSVPASSIIATETDSVFSTEPLDLDIGTGLGQWDCEVLEGIKYIQSGVSLVKKHGEWSFKTRGFTVARNQNEVRIWSEFLASKHPCLKVKQTRFGTDPRQAERFGCWYETIHKLRLVDGGIEKRVHLFCHACRKGLTYDEAMHQLRVPPIEMVESTGYKFAWNAEPDNGLLAMLNMDEPTLKLEYV